MTGGTLARPFGKLIATVVAEEDAGWFGHGFIVAYEMSCKKEAYSR